jgi:hypothetical protein
VHVGVVHPPAPQTGVEQSAREPIRIGLVLRAPECLDEEPRGVQR